MERAVATMVLMLTAGPLAAQDAPALPVAPKIFTAPAGCDVFVTVQMRGCVVAHHYICQQDAPGDQWDILFDMTGPFYQSRINAETQWVESINLPGGETSYLADGAADPASFSELLAKNLDTYDFSTNDAGGVILHYVGNDRLTGRKFVIDGVEMEQTEFQITTTDAVGNVLNTRSGNELISRDWRLFMSDREVVDDGIEQRTVVSTPVDFIFPGEDGFLSTVPKYDCDLNIAMAEVP